MGILSRGCAAAALGFVAAFSTPSERASAQELSDDEVLLENAREVWTGDLDGMIDRGFLRLATAYNPIFFSYDGLAQAGIVHAIVREMEAYLNKRHVPKGRKINVVIMPMPRDDILPSVIEGRADLAIANLTITSERQQIVDFSDPTYPNVSELVITGPGALGIESFDDLAESELHVRPSSSYFEHLQVVNSQRVEEGKPAIPVVEADERLEDFDLLELVEAGIIPAVIVDSHKAALWAQVFERITIHEDLAVNSGGQIAWGMRKESPKLQRAMNGFVKTIRKGSLIGNILIKRYLKNPEWVENIAAGDARTRYEETVDIIKTFAGQYDFDWLMITAQAFQESKLDQSKRSHAGAVGIMQVLPTTAADPNVGIPDINDPENNVHAGVKYLRFLRDRYYSKPEIDPLDQVLFSFAAYNAGPANVAKARKRASKMGLDPNRWFENVEIAAARAISREPVIYVRNIYKYYIAYRHMQEMRVGRKEAVQSLEN